MKVTLCFNCGMPFFYRKEPAPFYCSDQCRDAREEKLANALGKVAESMERAAEEKASPTPIQSNTSKQE